MKKAIGIYVYEIFENIAKWQICIKKKIFDNVQSYILINKMHNIMCGTSRSEYK